jgi:hypothetical protein
MLFVLPFIFIPLESSNSTNVTVDDLIIANTTTNLEINTTTSLPTTTAQGAIPEPIPVALNDLSSPSVHSRNVFAFVSITKNKHLRE